MSFYNKSTNFAVKDSLTTGDPNKIVSGVEIDTEFSNIASGFSSISTEIDNIQVIPSGAIQHFARNTAPTGWLEADGSDVSRSTFSALFDAIGTTFGAGNGSSTFTLPDLRGEFIRGWDDGRGVDSGREFGSGQSDENKQHDHGGSVGSVGNHSHSVTAARPNRQWRGDGFTIAGVDETFNSGGGGAHSHSISNSGGNESRPRNIALLVCIKA